MKAAIEQPAAKAFIQTVQLQDSITPKDVGPPTFQELTQMPTATAQGKVPEIHYVITDLIDRINAKQLATTPEAIQQRNGELQRLRQWAQQAHRITDNHQWEINIGGDKKYTRQPILLQSLLEDTQNYAQQPKHIPSLDLAPLSLTTQGAKKAARYLKELNPPPVGQSTPTPTGFLRNIKTMEELGDQLGKWYDSQKAEAGDVPPLTKRQVIELYTKTLPELGSKKYISNIRTPWYNIDDGKVLFGHSAGGFSQILQKAGEWWPVEIGYEVKNISLEESQEVENKLRQDYNLRAVEHFGSNSGVQTSLLAIPGSDRFGSSMGLPWVLGYDTGGKPRTTGALNKRLKAGEPGDFTDGNYFGNDFFEGSRTSWVDPEQPHKKLMAGHITLGTGIPNENGVELVDKIQWKTENTSVPAVNKNGEWDEGLEANAGMGRIKESAVQRWLQAGQLSPSMEKQLDEGDHPIRQFQIWHIDNTGPYKGMLEVIPDKNWRDGSTDMVISADMLKSDVKFTRGSVTRGTIKFAHDQEPFTRIGFLQQIANLAPMVGQDSIDKALRHAAKTMTDKEIQAVLYEDETPRTYNEDERPIAAALINILKQRGGNNEDLGQKLTGTGLSSPDAARAEMTAFQKFKAALSNRDIGSAYMPGLRLYFKHWKMAGLTKEPPPGHISLQWTQNPEGADKPPVPTGFVSREEEHNKITASTDGSDLDDELVVIPGYKINEHGQRKPAVILVRDPASPGNNIVKYLTDEDADRLNQHFGEDLYWHEIKAGPRQHTTISGQRVNIVDMPNAITEGPLVTNVEWQPEFDHGLPRKKSQMWAQSQMAGYVGALASALYTLDSAGLFDPEKHKLTASDAIDAIAKGTGDPRKMLNDLADPLMTGIHNQSPMPHDGLERIKGWLTPMYNARYGTNLTPKELVERVPHYQPMYRRATHGRALDVADKMQRAAQSVEWLANGAPEMLTQPNQTSPDLRKEAQKAINELSFLHQHQIPSMKAVIIARRKGLDGKLNQIEEQSLDEKLAQFASAKEQHIGQTYNNKAMQIMRDTRLSNNGKDIHGRKPGDIATALVQAQLARKTEALHELGSYGRIPINNLIKALDGMEQIAFYERMNKSDDILPTTVIHLSGKGMDDANIDHTFNVVKNDTGQIALVSNNAKYVFPVAKWGDKYDANATKLLGSKLIYKGELQTEGLTRSMHQTEPAVFVVQDAEEAIKANTQLEWDRPVTSKGGFFHRTEDDYEQDKEIQQTVYDRPKSAWNKMQKHKRDQNPETNKQEGFMTLKADYDEDMEKYAFTEPMNHAIERGEANFDDFSTRNPDESIGQWIHENVIEPEKGYEAILPNNKQLAVLHNAELNSPEITHEITMRMTNEPYSVAMAGWNARRPMVFRRKRMAKTPKGTPIVKG